MTMLFLITRSRRKRRSENIAFPFIVKSLPGSREARRIISIILWQSTLLIEEKHFLHFFSTKTDFKIRRWRKEYSYNEKWRRRHLKREDRKTSMKKKDDDSLPQKNVPYHDDRFIHRCRVRLCEDNQLYMLPSIYLLIIRRLYDFFLHIHSCWTREKKKEKEE